MADLIDDVQQVLAAIDFPFDSLRPVWAARAPKVVLALGRVERGQGLASAQAWGMPGMSTIGSRRLIAFLNEHWDEAISSGSYDDVRRKCVKFLVEAGVALKDPDDPGRAPNAGTTSYALSPAFGRLLDSWGGSAWDDALEAFRQAHDSLRSVLRQERARPTVAVTLPDGTALELSPGAHNLLQAAIIRDFVPQFVAQPEVIYIADALSRQLFKNDALLDEVGLFALDHRLLPDVVVLDRQRGWLLIIEAVASSGHISPIRKVELDRLLKSSLFPPVFVSAFPDYATFGRFAGDIAWETEVWVADHATHMIHYNGERFLGPYNR